MLSVLLFHLRSKMYWYNYFIIPNDVKDATQNKTYGRNIRNEYNYNHKYTILWLYMKYRIMSPMFAGVRIVTSNLLLSLNDWSFEKITISPLQMLLPVTNSFVLNNAQFLPLHYLLDYKTSSNWFIYFSR